MSGRKFAIIKAAHVPPRRYPWHSAQWGPGPGTVGHIYQLAAETDNLLLAVNYKPSEATDLWRKRRTISMALAPNSQLESSNQQQPLVDRAYKIFKRKLRGELKLTVNCHRVLNYSSRRKAGRKGQGPPSNGAQGELTSPKPDVRLPSRLFLSANVCLNCSNILSWASQFGTSFAERTNGILNGNQSESKAARILPSLEDARHALSYFSTLHLQRNLQLQSILHGH